MNSPSAAVSTDKNITVAQYLMRRLKQFGVDHFFGVPGDFILPFFMQHETDNHGLTYVGTCNELDAGYAADGYARLKGLGAIVCTYGPGSFSTLNAIAAAYAEDVPLLLITGGPSREAYADQRFAHHLLPGNYRGSLDIFQHVTAGTFLIDQPDAAAEMIDQAFVIAKTLRKPVYLEIPSDVQVALIAPPVPLTCPALPHTDNTRLLADRLLAKMTGGRTVLIPGHEIHRYGLQQQVIALCEKTGVATASLWYGKADYLEYLPQCIGGYQGGATLDGVREYIESADNVIFLGALETDFNLGGYTHALTPQQSVWIRRGEAIVDGVHLGDINIEQLVALLLAELPANLTQARDLPPQGFLFSQQKAYTPNPGAPLTDRRLYQRLIHFLRPDDIVTVDGGAAYNSVQMQAPRRSEWLYSVYWASIGHGFGTTLGAAMAADGRRVIAMTGDGSFQMTALEISNFARFGKSVVIVVVNNQGYTAERLIMDGQFNDVAGWRYHKLPEAFGSGRGIEVHTEGDLEEAVAVAEQWREPGPLLIEVHLHPMDASDCFKILAATLRGKAASH